MNERNERRKRKEQRRHDEFHCLSFPQSSLPASLECLNAFKRGIPPPSKKWTEKSFQFAEFFMFLCRHKHLYYISLLCLMLSVECRYFVWRSWLSSPAKRTDDECARGEGDSSIEYELFMIANMIHTNPHNLYTTRWDDENSNDDERGEAVQKKREEKKQKKVEENSQNVTSNKIMFLEWRALVWQRAHSLYVE